MASTAVRGSGLYAFMIVMFTEIDFRQQRDGGLGDDALDLVLVGRDRVGKWC